MAEQACSQKKCLKTIYEASFSRGTDSKNLIYRPLPKTPLKFAKLASPLSRIFRVSIQEFFVNSAALRLHFENRVRAERTWNAFQVPLS